MSNYETVTIFRTWVEIAEALKTDAERGRLYHAICRYSLYGEPPKLEGLLGTFFTLMQPSIDKSNRRKDAQSKSVQRRLQNNLQNGLQGALPDNSQTGLQNGLQTGENQGCKPNGPRARMTETETVTEEREILRAYAIQIENIRTKHPRLLNMQDDISAIAEAVRREADKPGETVEKAITLLDAATAAYAAAVAKWPKVKRKYIAPCGKWFREGRYLENPEMWEQETGGRAAKEGGTYVPRH